MPSPIPSRGVRLLPSVAGRVRLSGRTSWTSLPRGVPRDRVLGEGWSDRLALHLVRRRSVSGAQTCSIARLVERVAPPQIRCKCLQNAKFRYQAIPGRWRRKKERLGAPRGPIRETFLGLALSGWRFTQVEPGRTSAHGPERSRTYHAGGRCVARNRAVLHENNTCSHARSIVVVVAL
jgi:hypothetical protein